MGLNIKNERVHALAREAARRGHTSQTNAIEQALERYLATLDDDSPRESRVDVILHDFDVRLTDDDRRAIATDDMHDEFGLPR